MGHFAQPSESADTKIAANAPELWRNVTAEEAVFDT
jgi:hypothetical protein